MPYIPPEVLSEIKKMDLLTYLKNFEPGELLKFSSNTYTTKEHGSLKISNGMWCWWSSGEDGKLIGGKSALDYLIKVKRMTFMDAAQSILSRTGIQSSVQSTPPQKESKKLLLPEAGDSMDRVVDYLKRRGIDEEVIDFCIRTGRIYESRNRHNAVFVGMNEALEPKYAALRGVDTDFIGEASGSDKTYSFCLPASRPFPHVHLFESAIDLLSYATLMKQKGMDYHGEHLLSLAGIYQPKREIAESKVPVALTHFLEIHTEVQVILLHLDNDTRGERAAETLQMIIPKAYEVYNIPPPYGKDVNDYLCKKMGLPVTTREKGGKER